MKNVGIIGSGIVAKTLATGLLTHGFSVKIGTSDPDKLNDWLNASGEGASVGSFENAAVFGDLIILAVKGEAAENAIAMAGIKNIAYKTVIDTTNPIDHTRPPKDGVLHYFTSYDESLMERLQRLAPEANFVKAFNIVGNAYMVNPNFPDGKPSMFICGNQAEAKNEVSDLLDKFGWDVVDMGSVVSARAIEPLCMLWCIPGMLEGRWNHAFKLIRSN